MWTMYDDYSGNDPVQVRSDRYRELLARSKGFSSASALAASEYDDYGDDE